MTLDRQAYAALGPIYDAAMDQSRWQEALDSVILASGAIGAALLVSEREDHPYSVQALGGCYKPLIRTGEVAYYVEHLSPLEAAEWDALSRQRVQRLLLDSEVADSALLDQRADYCFLREKAGIGRRVGVRLNENRAWYDAMTVAYGAGLPAIPARSLARISPLLRHLAKAVEMGRAFSRLRARYAAVLSVLDRVHVGLAIALASGEVILANREADRIFDLADGVMLSRDRRIALGDPTETAQLQARIAEAALTADGQDDRSESSHAVHRPSGAHPFLIEVAPVADSARELGHVLSGAVITIIDPVNAPPLDIERFARLHGLTRAETAVCRHMIEGLTGSVIAEMRSTSPQTVKTQMASVLAKTGAANRSALIRLVVRTLPPIG